MYSQIKAVALRTIRHNDRSSILTAWSPELGRLSLLMPAGNGPEARRRRALTMPLALFECEADLRPGRDLTAVRDVKAWGPDGLPAPDVSSGPLRSSVAMFVAEVLGVVTREGDPDPLLWDLIVLTAYRIAASPGRELAALPVAFLIRLACVLGIEPDVAQWQPGRGLDLLEGTFRSTRALHDHWLDAGGSRVLVMAVKAWGDYTHLGLRIGDRGIRAQLLDGIVAYYSLHHYRLDKLKSLDVLRAVFAV